MKVAVLGCGPAGLMAAHAAKIAGASEVNIFSRRRKSELYGAQYLHSPIPGMTDGPSVTVHYKLVGSVEDYRRKVYGDDWDGQTSPEEHEGDHQAWDIRRTYSNLWEEYGGEVHGTEISKRWLQSFWETDVASGRYDLVISSVPKPLLCLEHPSVHRFNGQAVWALGDAPERGVFADDWYDPIPNNTVVCSGDPADYWYRVSRVFGYSTVEWPRSRVLPGVSGAAELVKPLDNNCDCWPGIIHVGRFGRWEKGVLSDSAFREVGDLFVSAP